MTTIRWIIIALLFCCISKANAAEKDNGKLPPPFESTVDFATHIQPLFEKNCYTCHTAAKQKGDLRLDNKTAALKGGSSGLAIKPGRSSESLLIHAVARIDKELKMPPEGEPLTAEEVGLLRAWIDQGATWPDSPADHVDEQFRKHWAFKPLERPHLPEVQKSAWVRKPVDYFILEQLEKAGLSPSPEADRVTLIRRLYGNLIGLPPSPAEVKAFVEDNDPQAYENLAERLLASPRYGERWARHWLDVVRFAESAGFETNLERPNAWPYRDYIIRSFNEDKPYNQFVMEQLAGDAMGADEATGFIVAGPWDAVKSPDINLTAQQRMDELHDMVATTGSAFLGLTVGCARCHNHKFDPVSQVDYYAMQAIFAGVEHGERPLKTNQTEERNQEANRLQGILKNTEQELGRFVPYADPSYSAEAMKSPPHSTINTETFPPVEAKFIRFNIFETIGNAEPCMDELEIYSTSANGQNIALAAKGVKATASGTLPGYAMHKLEHLIDGREGNDYSWISDSPGTGWVLLELPQPERIDKLVWGRDRTGKLNDRLPLVYTIEVGNTLQTMKKVAGRGPLRPPVNARENIERFEPAPSKFLRFTIEETSNLEPCLDEVEVFTSGSDTRNVALSAAGAKATASSSYPGSKIHRLEHVNDGLYGNGRSWISHEMGKGWVQLEFPQTEMIHKIIWGRDRELQYSDRLATKYSIATSVDGINWVKVAGSNDREKYLPDTKPKPIYSAVGLSMTEASSLNSLLAQQSALQKKIRELTTVPSAYIGRFEKPPLTHRLHRGEALQKKEVVAPASIEFIGQRFQLKEDSEEQQRRLALAKWIVDPANPLTARVMVNRIWQYHFGNGIVETSSDFGLNGGQPTHPELMDWLAAEFISNGWSVKAIQRAIVLSSVYRQDSKMTSQGAEMDAGTRLLWRFPPRRLEAEVLRDSILDISGNLELSMGGPGFDLFQPNGNYVKVYNPKKEFGPAEWRRMIYQSKPRMQLDDVFGAFDCPDAGQIAPKRSISTTPLQALNLLNSHFILQQCSIMAKRLDGMTSDPARQVEITFQAAFHRNPTPSESSAAVTLIKEAGLTSFCRAIFNANEFAYMF
ncbi:MAG: DUF1553 domain-containing protein [Verrucomicrobiales bacterium]